MMRISKRLATISALIDHDSVVADVGSDHGKLLLYLHEQGRISKGYGIENKSGPFLILQESLSSLPKAQLIAIMQDGISHLESDVDTLVLAGLGGETIIRILNEGLINLPQIKTIITDAHTAIGDVRRQVVKLGYYISAERLVYDHHKYYQIVKFAKTAKSVIYTDFEYEYGPFIIRDESFRCYASKLIADIDAILDRNISFTSRQTLIKQKEALSTYEY